MGQDHGQARWQAIWQSRGPAAWALRPLAWLYGGLSSARRWMYRAKWLKIERLPVPVVVVGNVVVGGAGKTPTVLALIQHLSQQGWRPGVVSRGYGRQGSAVIEVLAETPSQASGDEPALIRRRTGVPVFVAKRRTVAARALLAAHPGVNIILCDDGLQHLALGRDLAIAVFDDRGTGNGWLLPAGLLREPWPPKAGVDFSPDCVLLQGLASGHSSTASPFPTFQAMRRLHPEAVNGLGARLPLSTWATHAFTALAGIARPEAFFNMLHEAGLAPTNTVALADHADANAYGVVLRHHQGPLLCTEKDAVKLFDTLKDHAPLDAARIWAVPLALEIDPAFFSAVDAHLSHLRAPAP